MEIPNDDDGYTKEVIKVEYEWKPPHCVDCKIFGHSLSQCPKRVMKATFSASSREATHASNMEEQDEGFIEDITKVHSLAKSNMNTLLSDNSDLLNTVDDDAGGSGDIRTTSINRSDSQKPNVSDPIDSEDESDEDKVYMSYDEYNTLGGGGFSFEDDDLDCYDVYKDHVYDLSRKSQAFCDNYDTRLKSHVRNLITQEASTRAVELEKEYTSLSKNTSGYLVEEESLEPQEDVVPIRRSERTHRVPDRFCLNVEVEERSLGDPNEPANNKATLSYLKFDKWLVAMNAKMQSMKDNQVWCLVDLPPIAKTVRSKWIFKKKTDIDGNVHAYKVHLVSKGYTQTYCIDYKETFSLVANIRAIRIPIVIFAYYDYEIWQIDVKITFLNGYLNDDIFMVQ
nr:putative retrotransposon Ty1-copia subclass protein [Tanacetum cinerariifolium]GEW32636.1 putative retrotransposon Ty1-copia subclass protein [Tanacetum cinerariifolium]